MDVENRLCKRLDDLISDDYSPEVAYPLRARLARVVNESTRWLASGKNYPQALQQAKDRLAAGERWTESGIVFTTRLGTGMDAANVRRDLRRALTLVPGLDPADWTPRELRHSFVSLLSDAGVPLEDIAHLVGHSGTSVTELVYRHQIRPVIQTGATVMDRLFGRGGSGA